MRFLSSLVPSLFILGAAGVAQAASAWSFDEATISVQSKGGAGNGFQEKLSPKTPLANAVSLGATDSLKIILTAKDGSKAARPHQAYLLLKDPETGLETAFPFSVKDTGKGKVEVAQKDLPIQLAVSSTPLEATLILASFGSSTPFGKHVFNLDVKTDPALAPRALEKPLRYGKRPEIHHIFRPDPKSPPKVISLFFALAVIGALPILFGAWVYLGANLSHATQAIGAAPISHSLFFGSIVSMEFVFFLYYSTWTLFQTLPVAGVIGLVAYISGSKALSEVQGRRLAGQR